MKSWLTSSKSKEASNELSEAGHALALQAVVSLFSGREIATRPWAQIAERYRILLAARGGKSHEQEPEAVGALAEVVCSLEVEIAKEIASRIPSDPESELYSLVARAIIDHRVARSNPRISEPQAALADSLYALMPKYYQNIDNYLAGSLRILSLFLQFFAYKKELRGTFPQASSLTAGTSQLASRYGIYRYVDAVIEIGERVLEANRGAVGREAVGFWTIANNLANLHVIEARDNPSARPTRYSKALVCAEAAFASLKTVDSEDVPIMRETTLKKLAEYHVNLALEKVDDGKHAAEAIRFAKEYAITASDQAAAEKSVDRVSQTLASVDAFNEEAQYESDSDRLLLECTFAAARFAESAQEYSKRIAAAQGGTQERMRVAAELLENWYEELTKELDRAIPASGFDWSVCKLVLALGAIASGQLGELTGAVVESWFGTVKAPQDAKPWTRFRARQYMSTGGESQTDRTSAAGRIVGLAMLVDSLEQSAPDIRFREMIRTHNARLLKRMIQIRPLFQECSGPALSSEEDLEALSRVGRMIFRGRFDVE